MNNSPIKSNKEYDNKVIYKLKRDESKSFALDFKNSEIVNLNGVKLSHSDINISTLDPESLIVVYIDKEYKIWLDKRSNENQINRDKVRKEEELRQQFKEKQDEIHGRYKNQYAGSHDSYSRYKKELEDNTILLNKKLQHNQEYYDQLMDHNNRITTVSAPIATLHYYTYKISNEEKNKKIFEQHALPIDFLEPVVIKFTQIRDNHATIEFKCGCNNFKKDINLTNIFLKTDGKSIDYTQYLNKNFQVVPGDNILDEMYSLDIHEYDEKSGETGDKIGTFPTQFLGFDSQDNEIYLYYYKGYKDIDYYLVNQLTLKQEDGYLIGYISNEHGDNVSDIGKNNKLIIAPRSQVLMEEQSDYVEASTESGRQTVEGVRDSAIQIKAEVDSAKTSVEKVKQDIEESRSSSLQAKEEAVRARDDIIEGMFKKVCQTAFLVQLNFQWECSKKHTRQVKEIKV